MKPAPFEYFRAGSVAEACAALKEAGGGAKLIAGGQSLGPMLNLRLVQPRVLIDIAGIEELSDFDQDVETLKIGACITAADIEDQRISTADMPMLARVAGGIAYRAVRNRGTIGGSICHADPAADWVNFLPAIDAAYVLAKPAGTRTIPAGQFIFSAFETVLEPDEVLTRVLIPKLSKNTRWGYSKISLKAGKFAMAIGLVVFDPSRDMFRAVLGATQGKPIVLPDAREIFVRPPGEGPLKIDISRVEALLAERGIGSGPSRQLHWTALRRAAAEAFAP